MAQAWRGDGVGGEYSQRGPDAAMAFKRTLHQNRPAMTQQPRERLGLRRRPERADAVAVAEAQHRGLRVLGQGPRRACFRVVLGDELARRDVVVFQPTRVARGRQQEVER